MRVYTRVGDVYEVKVNEKEFAYFQFVGKDKSYLGGNVIRVFAERYTERPMVETILSGEVDFYTHTFVSIGTKFEYWAKVGHSDNLGSMDIWFRDTNDTLEKKEVSYNWVVWKFNGPLKFVGRLPKKYFSAYLGFVRPPEGIVEHIITKTDPVASWYPGFRKQRRGILSTLKQFLCR